MSDPRDEVKWFANQMESQLKENDHKGGWQESSTYYLLLRLMEEYVELENAIRGKVHESDEVIIKDAADIANFAMMIADKARKGLLTKGAKETWQEYVSKTN